MQNVKKTYKLFLDDLRTPYSAYEYTRYTPFLVSDWKIARNYNQFVKYIKSNWEKHQYFPELIAFDHDLSDSHYFPNSNWDNYVEWEKTQDFKEKNGYECAKWLVNFCVENDLDLPDWVCHSMNPVGRDNINFLLENFKKHKENE